MPQTIQPIRPDSTDRAVFDRVSSHLLSQGVRSTAARGVCVYRSTTGLRCAIGCLISEGAYSPSLEGTALSDGPMRAALFLSGVPDRASTVRMLNRLRAIHDDCDPEGWPDRLASVEACLDHDGRYSGPGHDTSPQHTAV